MMYSISMIYGVHRKGQTAYKYKRLITTASGQKFMEGSFRDILKAWRNNTLEGFG